MEKCWWDTYKIEFSEFAYNHFKDRSLTNFRLIDTSRRRRQLRRQREVIYMDSFSIFNSYELPMLHEFCCAYSYKYPSSQKRRLSEVYRIELLTMKSSRINATCKRTFDPSTTVYYDVVDNKDIWEKLLPATRKAFFE